MNNDHLQQAQQALRDKLANDEFTPLIDKIDASVGRAVGWIMRSTQPVPYWYSALVVALLILGIDFGVSMIRQEFYEVRRARIPSEVALVALTFFGSLIVKHHVDVTYNLWRTQLIDKVQAVPNLQSLETWFRHMSNIRVQVPFAIIGGTLGGYAAIYFVSDARNGWIGLGPALLIILVNIQLAIGFYYVMLFLYLPVRVRTFHMRLFSIHPRRSETLYLVSHIISSFVYTWAIFLAAITLVLSLFAVMNWVNILILILLGWMPIIAAFFLNQVALSSLINRSKWSTLNELQVKIETERTTADLSQKEPMERLQRLLDYHNRIWSSPNSVIDFDSVINFGNALLLPLITLALGNFETIVNFWSR